MNRYILTYDIVIENSIHSNFIGVVDLHKADLQAVIEEMSSCVFYPNIYDTETVERFTTVNKERYFCLKNHDFATDEYYIFVDDEGIYHLVEAKQNV